MEKLLIIITRLYARLNETNDEYSENWGYKDSSKYQFVLNNQILLIHGHDSNIEDETDIISKFNHFISKHPEIETDFIKSASSPNSARKIGILIHACDIPENDIQLAFQQEYSEKVIASVGYYTTNNSTLYSLINQLAQKHRMENCELELKELWSYLETGKIKHEFEQIAELIDLLRDLSLSIQEERNKKQTALSGDSILLIGEYMEISEKLGTFSDLKNKVQAFDVRLNHLKGLISGIIDIQKNITSEKSESFHKKYIQPGCEFYLPDWIKELSKVAERYL